MAKQNNPFNIDPSKFLGDFDPSKFLGDFDPSKFMGEFTKVMGEFKVADFDTNAVLESQRKNLEAVAEANKLAVEGVQAVFKRQAEILQQTADELSKSLADFTAPESVQDGVAKQTDLVKEAVEKALANARELAEIVSKSNTEAFQKINTRFNENLEEVKAQVLKLKH